MRIEPLINKVATLGQQNSCNFIRVCWLLLIDTIAIKRGRCENIALLSLGVLMPRAPKSMDKFTKMSNKSHFEVQLMGFGLLVADFDWLNRERFVHAFAINKSLLSSKHVKIMAIGHVILIAIQEDESNVNSMLFGSFTFVSFYYITSYVAIKKLKKCLF